MRDAALTLIGGNGPFCFWLMKFFPLAFFVTWNEPMPSAFRMAHLNMHRTLPATARQTVYLPTRPLLPARWPETPDDRSFILYGQEAVIALEARQRRAVAPARA